MNKFKIGHLRRKRSFYRQIRLKHYEMGQRKNITALIVQIKRKKLTVFSNSKELFKVLDN
ncbi:MAG: hypothetical protein GF347_00710 [Candidatus Moranbacteria bacterium]|nr:hypothetical protein [Candidatus Moranbacteria bacterium]